MLKLFVCWLFDHSEQFKWNMWDDRQVEYIWKSGEIFGFIWIEEGNWSDDQRQKNDGVHW